MECSVIAARFFNNVMLILRKKGREVTRIAIVVFSAFVLATIAMTAIAVFLASPGPGSQEILGVGIGDPYGDKGRVFLSGRRLHCVSLAEGDPFASVCTISIAGKPLTIRARRNPPTHPVKFGGECAATYGGEQWPCRIGSRHVQVHWFAYIDDPLGLDQTQLDALRRRYLVENLPEEAFVRGMVAVPLVVSVVILLLAGVWLSYRRSAGVRIWLAAILVSMFTGVVVFTISVFLTNGFWD